MNFPNVLDSDLRLVSEAAAKWRAAPGNIEHPETKAALQLLKERLHAALGSVALVERLYLLPRLEPPT